jgi:hypothetical protein
MIPRIYSSKDMEGFWGHVTFQLLLSRAPEWLPLKISGLAGRPSPEATKAVAPF